MSANVIREIQTALRTGKVVIGYKQTRKKLANGEAKMVILAKNAPTDIVEEILYYSKLADVPVYIFEGTSRELGAACNKPFFVSAMAIIHPGESSILDIVKGETWSNQRE